MTLTIARTTRVEANRPPSVVLTVTDTAPGNAAAFVDVMRVHADGSRHRVLSTTADPQLSGGVWGGVDYHLPYGQNVTYEATVAGVTATSLLTWVLSDYAWLIHPSLPALSVRVAAVRVIPDRVRASRATRFQPLPDPDAAVRSIGTTFLTEGIRNGMTGTMTVKVSVADEARVDALTDDDGVILVNTPGTAGWDLKWLWIQPGEVKFQNYTGLKDYPWRNVELPFEQSADPDIDIVILTYDESDTIGATYASTGAVFATYAALQTNTRS